MVTTTDCVAMIDKWYEDRHEQRARLGLSEIGHPCNRYLWYCHHAYPKVVPSGQQLRLFEIGKTIEGMVIHDLRNAGFKVYDLQKELCVEYDSVCITGSIDGIIEFDDHPNVLEIKSANEKHFKELKKIRSYEKWNLKYKAQIHAYMLALKINYAFVIVYCKNNSELYTEIIRLNEDYIVSLLVDKISCLKQNSEPDRECPDTDYYEAKWCGYHKECFNL